MCLSPPQEVVRSPSSTVSEYEPPVDNLTLLIRDEKRYKEEKKRIKLLMDQAYLRHANASAEEKEHKNARQNLKVRQGLALARLLERKDRELALRLGEDPNEDQTVPLE